jgi:hypothetical protein
MKKGTHLISNQGYLDSVRYLGLTTLDSISELIDNSLDAKAKNIDIFLIKNESKNISLIIQDDGEGIPQDKIDQVLSFGGRNPYENHITVGKFGWGLPSAACCQSPRTELYSKTKTGDWHYSYIDLNELKTQAEPIIPPSVKKKPNKDWGVNNKLKSGSIVNLTFLDHPDYKTIEKLSEYFEEHIGEVYRYYIQSGIVIRVNKSPVKITDPLMLIKDCKDSDILGYAKIFDEIEPIIINDEIDPQTKKGSEIKIKVVLMNLEQIRDNENWLSLVRKKGYNVDNQGFYIVRQHRQIARALTLGIFQRHNDLNYFRVEISFPPSLDKYFGVQTNKSRFSLDSTIKENIENRLNPILVQIRKISKEFQKKAMAQETNIGIRPAEEIASKVDGELKKSGYLPTPKEIQKEEKELENLKNEEIQKVKSNENLNPKEKEEIIGKIENKFQFNRPFVRALESVPFGPFYYYDPKGNSSRVVINISHPFYTKIYERATQNNLDVFLDLLLFTLAKAESIYYHNDTTRKFYEDQRNEWSTILKKYLDQTPDSEE